MNIVATTLTDPVWAPDGKGIYFRFGQPPFHDVFFVPLEGEVVQITHGDGNVRRDSVSVSPIGMEIAFMKQLETDRSVVV